MQSKCVNFVSRLRRRLSDKACINIRLANIRLANPFVHAAWKFCANSLMNATLTDRNFVSLSGWHQKWIRGRGPLCKIVRTQGHGDGKIVVDAAAWANIGLAAVCPLFFKNPKLAEQLWIIQQLNFALDENMF